MAKQGALWLQRAFWLMFFLCFGWIWLGTVRHWQYNGRAALLAGIVLGAAAVWVLFKLGAWVDGLTERQWHLLKGIGLALSAAALAAAGLITAQVLIMDLDVVWQSLPDFLDSVFLERYNVYYLECNNNLGLALLLAGFFRVLAPFGIAPGTPAGMAAAILLNCLALWLTVVLILRAARLLTGRRAGEFCALGLCLIYLPFYLWAPVFYSDTLVMPFLMGTLVLFLQFRKADSVRTRLALAAAMGVLTFFGFAVKGSLAVLLVALPIQLFLEQVGGLRAAARTAAVLLITFVLVFAGYRTWQHHAVLDYTEYETYGFPIELWFTYGSHGVGDYDPEDFDACIRMPTLTQRREVLTQRLRQNYSSYTLPELARFMTRKAVVTWGDGKFDADQFTATPQRANWSARFLLRGQPGYMPMTYVCQALHNLLLGLVVFSGLLPLLRGDRPGGLAPVQLTLFGVMLFLSLWETKARYALHVAPCLVLCGAVMLTTLAGGLEKLRGTPPDGANITPDKSVKEF